jgi:sarcosine oxidase, subunit gamma
MSDRAAASALNGAVFAGYARIRDIGPLGMITLRAAQDLAGLAAAIKAATGCAIPPQRGIETAADGKRCAWMSPDEYLLLMPQADVPAALQAIAQALAGQHHLALDVSHARAVFAVEGMAQSVLAKLTPTDFAALAPNELRRTRLAQVPAAFWLEGGNATVICFRSVAQYVFDLLSHAARPGTEI